MDNPIAIGVDLSLTGTGVGFVGHDDDKPEVIFETYRFGRSGKRDESLDMRLDRIEQLVDDVRGAICEQMQWPQIAVMEAPATSAAGGSSHDRSAAWWLMYRMLTRKMGIPTIQVTTQKLKIYATGKGNKLDKEEVLIAMLRRHPEAPIRNNDEADGLTLALMGARLLGQPVDGNLAKVYLRALDGVAFP